MSNPCNTGTLVGSICSDIELKTSQKGASYLNMSVQVRKNYTSTQKYDFINTISFGRTAEFIAKYFKKGDPIVCGFSISPTKQIIGGKNYWFTSVVVQGVSFTPYKATRSSDGDTGFDEGEEQGGFDKVEYEDTILPF